MRALQLLLRRTEVKYQETKLVNCGKSASVPETLISCTNLEPDFNGKC